MVVFDTQSRADLTVVPSLKARMHCRPVARRQQNGSSVRLCRAVVLVTGCIDHTTWYDDCGRHWYLAITNGVSSNVLWASEQAKRTMAVSAAGGMAHLIHLGLTKSAILCGYAKVCMRLRTMHPEVLLKPHPPSS